MTETPPTTEDYGGDGVEDIPHFLHSDDFPSSDVAVTWATGTAIRHEFLLGVGCKFVIKVAERRDRSGFFIVVKAGEHGKHNHELVVYPEGHRQITGLSSKAKQLVREMSDAQTKPSQIVVALQQKFLTDNPTMRHVYNYRDNIRRERSDARNPAQQVLHEKLYGDRTSKTGESFKNGKWRLVMNVATLEETFLDYSRGKNGTMFNKLSFQLLNGLVPIIVFSNC
ncbi:30S ribosomal protein S8 [Bienertia sinuspersici]